MENNAYTPAPQHHDLVAHPHAHAPRSAGRGLSITALILAAATLLGLVLTIGLLIYTTVRLNNEKNDLTRQIDSLNSKVADQANRLAFQEVETRRFWIASDMHGSGVTDEFVTTNVLFCDKDVVMLDTDVQPAFSSSYTGQGKFTISDDELKTKLTALVQDFKSSYNNAKLQTMSNFSALEIQVMINGYDVATYKNGELSLTSE